MERKFHIGYVNTKVNWYWAAGGIIPMITKHIHTWIIIRILQKIVEPKIGICVQTLISTRGTNHLLSFASRRNYQITICLAIRTPFLHLCSYLTSSLLSLSSQRWTNTKKSHLEIPEDRSKITIKNHNWSQT